MKRQFVIHNRSAFRDEEIIPLLNFSWDCAWEAAPTGHTQINQHPRYSRSQPRYGVFLTAEELDFQQRQNCIWHVHLIKSIHMRAGMAYVGSGRVRIRLGDPKKISVTWPRNETYGKFKDMPEFQIRSWREMIIRIAAHEFAHLTGHDGVKAGEEKAELTAWDAVEKYRQMQAEIDGEIDRRCACVDKKRECADARERAKFEEKNSTQFKLDKLAKAEAIWTRKLRLASTKLSKIRRSRSCILAAQRRRQAVASDPCPPPPAVDAAPVEQNMPAEVCPESVL